MTLRWKIAQYAESRWWKNYLSNQPVDSYLEWKRNYWRSFLKNHNIVVEGQEAILDAGCGPAGIFTILSKNKIIAIDPLLDKYEKELSHFKQAEYPNVIFENSKIEDFTDENKFDKIFCLNAINHVRDLNLSIKRLSDSLKENGLVYLSVDAHNYSLLKNVFQIFPGDILHPHQLNLKDYKKQLIKNNLQIENVDLIKKEFIFNYYLISAKKQLNK